jgi:hypothetical protein
MRRIPLLLALVTAVTACAASPLWPDRLDITLGTPVDTSPPPAHPAGSDERGLMVCVVDAEGRARCHHRDGVVSSKVGAAGTATCPGAEAPLRSICEGPGACLLPGIDVPVGQFGLLVFSLRPPALGLPRHVVAEAVIVTRAAGGPEAHERRALTDAMHAIAGCVAPDTRRGGGADPSIVTLGACVSQGCDLARMSLKLARHARVSMTGR